MSFKGKDQPGALFYGGENYVMWTAQGHCYEKK